MSPPNEPTPKAQELEKVRHHSKATEAHAQWNMLRPVSILSADAMKNGISKLSPAWRLFLLGDGSPTKQLQILTGSPTAVDVIDISVIGENLDHAPEELRLIPGPRVRRQVWLRTEAGERLGYAISWWHDDKSDVDLKTESIPIGKTIAGSRRELYRDICSVFLGTSATLEKEFGHAGPFWGRYYVFYSEGKPLTLIYEVFSPALRQYLGDVSTK